MKDKNLSFIFRLIEEPFPLNYRPSCRIFRFANILHNCNDEITNFIV